MKRLSALLLLLLLLSAYVFALPAAAAAEGTLSDGWMRWSLDDDGTLTVSGTGRMPDFQFDASSHPIGAWNDPAYKGLVKKVVISNGINYVSSFAFSGCTSLETLVLEDGVASVSWGAFQGCTALKDVSLGEGVVTIGYNVFDGCTSLEEITLPESVETVRPYAFNGCTSLKTVHVKSAGGAAAFYAPYLDISNNTVYSGTEDVETVILSGQAVATDYIKTNFPYTQSLQIEGEDCVVYKKTESVACTEHVYDNDCDEDCNVCGEKRSVQHVYDNDCDEDCNICGKRRTVQHVYGEWQADGDTHKRSCTVCGAETEPESHSYDANGVCTVCGAKKPAEIRKDVRDLGKYAVFAFAGVALVIFAALLVFLIIKANKVNGKNGR